MKNELDKKMSGSKLTGREIAAYFKKNPKANAVYKAVVIALDHGGAMTYAMKEIEKLKKGMSKHPEVKKALRWANESTHSIARNTFAKIVTENYTKNFELLCQSLKFNKIQQRILDQFISHGTIKNQYVGRVAGRKKETKIFAAKKRYTGSLESRKGALMQALKVNAKQKNILDAYLSTGRVIGKYAGSVAGSTKTTKDYTAFRGFKESYDILSVLNEAAKGATPYMFRNKSDAQKFAKFASKNSKVKVSRDNQGIDIVKVFDLEKSEWLKLGKYHVQFWESVNEAKFSPALIKKAIAIANSPKYKDYYSGAYRAIEKLKKGLEDDPKVLAALKAANEGYASKVHEGYASNDPKVKAIAKKFKKDIQDIRRGYMDVEDGTKLYDAVYAYLSNSERGNWKDPDFAFEKVTEFIHDMSKFGMGKV